MSGLLLKTVFLLLGIFSIDSTIVTDTGCLCALTKTAITAPNASTTVAVGCSFKTDWNGQTSEWCLTDQSQGTCGTFQSGFGWADSCLFAGFPTVNVMPPPIIEWDQDVTTFYTGQNINVTWTYQNILADEWVRVQYMGVNLRTLTSGSGTNITTGFYASRLSDSNNAITSKATPIIVNLPSTASITQNSVENITVIQSKVMSVIPLDGNRTLGGGQNTVCDDRNLTVMWRGLGEAQFGVATISLSRQGGFGGSSTLGTTLNNVPVSGNVSLTFFCPRTATPSTFNPYAFSISVQEPGGSAYTANSASFNVAQAPTPTPTSSTTPTPTKTPTSSVTPTKSPTPSPSTTPSPTSSSSETRTPTPSITSTVSPTPSTTETARPSIDYALIARNAADAVDTETPVIGAVIGTLAGVILFLGAFKYYSHLKLTELRKKKQKMTSQRVQETRSLYGIYESDEKDTTAPNIVMYQVNVGKPLQTSKKAFTPVTKS